MTVDEAKQVYNDLTPEQQAKVATVVVIDRASVTLIEKIRTVQNQFAVLNISTANASSSLKSSSGLNRGQFVWC